MPYNFPTYRLSFGGTLPGNEIWQCSVHLNASGAPSPTQADMDAAAVRMKGYISTFVSSTPIASLFSTGVRTTFVRLYLTPNGATKASLVADGGAINVAGTGTLVLPNQCALVCSLRSSNPGRTGRGRFYLPASGGDVSGTTGQLAAPDVTDVAGAVATLLESLNGDAVDAVVFGGTSGSPINRVDVDTVIDTQRRRRNAVRATTVGVATVDTA